jgi:2-dehydropantoate 2-reductase
MRIAIFGTGGVGGYFGARLALAGEEVTFLARGAHLRAMQQDGLVVETPAGELHVEPARATDDPAAVGEVDVVLVAVKTWQVPAVAAALAPMLGPETFVVPLQNGVEAAAELAAVIGAERVLGGLCGTVSRVLAPGRIASLGEVNLVRFAELDGRASERALRLRQAFERARVQVEVPADIRVALWEKFLFVVPFGGLGAITRAPIGVTRGLAETRALLTQGMGEIFAVGRAHGVALRDDSVEAALGWADRLAAGATASLQRDVAEGRPSELEAWNGAVVRLGREKGVATPFHTFVYHALLPLERRARGELAFP